MVRRSPLSSPTLLPKIWVSALLGGKVIGLPPVLDFGSPEIKDKVVIGFFHPTVGHISHD
jgi:hypothetical protein